MDNETKQILDTRLAKGEISQDTYLEIIQTINDLEESPNKGNKIEEIIIQPTNDLTLFNNYLEYNGERISYDRIEGLTYSRSSSSINLLPVSQDSVFVISFIDRKRITYTTDTTIFRGKKSKLLQEAHSFLQQKTFSSRLKLLFNKFKTQGFIKPLSNPKFTLHTNGDIEQNNLKTNLHTAYKNKDIHQGSSEYKPSGAIISRNSDILIYMPKENIFKKRKFIQVSVHHNADIVFHLINNLIHNKI